MSSMKNVLVEVIFGVGTSFQKLKHTFDVEDSKEEKKKNCTIMFSISQQILVSQSLV